MAKHLIAVGGSGQHVALAYMDLVALVHRIHNVQPIHVYIVDKDETMGEGGATAWQAALQQCERLRLADDGLGATWPDFRNNRIPPCVEVIGKSKVNEAVSRIYGPMLYTREQLEVLYGTGYWGQAPVGAAFFGDVIRRANPNDGTALSSILADPAARVVVAGSTVGGTGAGCLPRLVEHLASAGPGGPGSRVMAIPLLQWFSLAPTRDNKEESNSNRRNQEMRSRVPSALLYSRDSMAKCAATVLIGHPNPDTAAKRPWGGNTQQAPHEDLTVPHYAAAVASVFLFGEAGLARGIYCVACPADSTGLRLDPALWLFDGGGHHNLRLQLGNLVRLNYQFCTRMAWVLRYIGDPPSGRNTCSPGSMRVRTLDEPLRDTKVDDRQRLLKTGKALLDAKWAALRRLHASDSTLCGSEQPKCAKWQDEFYGNPLPGGLPALRTWLREQMPAPLLLGHVTDNILAHLPDATEVPAKNSAARCLPPMVGGGAKVTPSPNPPGYLDNCATEQILASELVAPESLPTPAVVEFYLAQLFAGRLGQDVYKEDTAKKWTERWRLLLLGIASHTLTMKRAPQDEGDVKLLETPPQYLITDEKGQCFGMTSAETLLVPAISPDWKGLGSQTALADGQPAVRAVMGWFDLLARLRENSAHKSTAAPGWFAYQLEHWIPELRRKNASLRSFGFASSRPLAVRWGDGDCRQLLLPTTDAHSRQDLLAMLPFFGIQHVPLDRTRLSGEQKKFLDQLADEACCPVYTPVGPNTDGTSRKLVWRRETPELADVLSFGFVLYTTKDQNQQDLSVASDVEVGGAGSIEILDSVQDILLGSVEPLGDNSGRRKDLLPTYPVQLRYADLVDRSQKNSCSTPNAGMVTYDFAVRGVKYRVSHPFPIGRTRPGTFLLWPNYIPPRVGESDFKAYYALAHSSPDGASAWFLGKKTSDSQRLDWTCHVERDEVAQPLYKIDGTKVDGGIPLLMVVVENRQENPLGGGLFEWTPPSVSSVSQERWGVDFGSSSSVVAVYSHANKGEGDVLRLAGEYDATYVFALNETKALSACTWFPTWDEAGPRRTVRSSLIPSQLLVTRKVTMDAADRAKAESLPYGKAFVLDHGGDLDKDLQRLDVVIRDLKWLEVKESTEKKQKRSLRRAYLIHLLELCFAMRARFSSQTVPTGLPDEVTVVFTLPLRMRDPNGTPAREFEQDAVEVCALLTKLLGRTITAEFIWESRVGAPRQRLPNDICAVADLGGGSLDLWGGIGQETEREYADSYRFGGHDLLQQWCEHKTDGDNMREQRVLDMRRRFQGDPDTCLDEMLRDKSSRETQEGFFELAREAAARWIAALILHPGDGKQGNEIAKKKVHLSLLGMGWGLSPLVTKDEAKFVRSIGKRVQQLVGGTLPDDVVCPMEGGEVMQGRKTYLARNAARRGGQSMDELLKGTMVGFMGFDIFYSSGEKHEWHEQTPLSLEGRNPKDLLLNSTSVVGQPTPTLGGHPLTRGDLDGIINDMQEAIREGTYTGPTPFSLAMERLRHRSKAQEEKP